MKHVILDMGGVLLDLNWQESIMALLPPDTDLDTMLTKWAASECVCKHERGELAFDAFADCLAKEYRTEYQTENTTETVKAAFMKILGPLKPSLNAQLADIRQQAHSLSLLSNTSPPHIAHLSKTHDFFDHFDKLFLSYEMGIMKPATAIYQRVLNDIGCEAHESVFFDDSQVNIDGAKALGMDAWRVESPSEITTILRSEYGMDV